MGKNSLKKMIESVIDDLTNNEPINRYVLKLQVISRNLKNETFTRWLEKEIDGYIKDVDIPPYRIFTTQVVANVIIDHGFKQAKLSNHIMPLFPLGKELAKEISTLKIRDSIISLGSIVESNDSIAYSTTDYERVMLSKVYENCTILSAYKSIQKSDIELVLHSFKSNLLNIFMEFNETIFDDEIDFDMIAKKKDIDKIIHQTINTGIYLSDHSNANINGSTVVGGVDNKVHLNAKAKNELDEIITKVEQLSQEIEADREDIAREILSIREELENTIQRPKIIKSALFALKGITMGVAGNKATELIDDALKVIKETMNK